MAPDISSVLVCYLLGGIRKNKYDLCYIEITLAFICFWTSTYKMSIDDICVQ